MSRARELADLSNVINKGANLQPNLIINGDMSVDQRNDGSAVTATHGSDTFCPDRYRFIENHSGSFSLQQVQDAPDDLEYSMKVTVTGTDTSLGVTEFARTIQPIEGQNISHLNWGSASARTCTLTFYVKSSVTGKYYISVFNNAANRSFVSGYTINTADTWEKKTITITGDTSGTWLTTNGGGIFISWSLGTGTTYQTSNLDSFQGTFAMAGSDQINLAATNSATWQLTGVSFVVGDTAPVTHPYESFDQNLKRCQRYFLMFKPETSAGVTHAGALNGGGRSSTAAYCVVHFPEEMRIRPSSANSGTLTWYFYNSSRSVNSVAINGSTKHSLELVLAVNSISNMVGSAGWVRIQSGAFLSFDAEL